MRRGGTRIGIIVVVLVGLIVTGFVAYGRGQTAGQTAASNDRSAFAARGTTVGGGFGGRGAGGTGGGQRPGGAASAITGTVTKVANGTLTLQEQPGNTTATVATSVTTMVTTFAPGTLSDLAMGDIVALQGDKTGDTAYTAKTIYVLNGAQAGGAAGRTQGGTSATEGTAPAGSPTSGGRNRASGGASGSAPAGGFAGGGLFAGLNGPIGRITKVDTGTLMLQGFDGTTTMVTTTPRTSVRTQAPGDVSDIKAGDTVSVQGDTTGDTTAPARAIIDLGTGT